MECLRQRINSKDAHDGVWSQTKEDVRELLGVPKEDAQQLRNVAFCLPSVLVHSLLSRKDAAAS